MSADKQTSDNVPVPAKAEATAPAASAAPAKPASTGKKQKDQKPSGKKGNDHKKVRPSKNDQKVIKIEEKEAKMKESYSSSEEYRHLQGLLDGESVSSCYLVPPTKLFGLSVPAFVSRSPFPSWVPCYYHFNYSVVPIKIANRLRPAVHVFQTDFKFGKQNGEHEFDIEYELMTGCFNKSTVRDYTTLVNSIFMTVNRGLADVPKASFDINAKLDAIAAIYLLRHPDFQSDFGLVSKILTDYRPRVEGWYAIGSTATPDQGESAVKPHWKEERVPAKAWYVARLLDESFAGIVHCGFMPARTKSEFMKAFAKRLTAPPRNPFTDSHGKVWDLSATRRVIQHTVDWFLNGDRPRWQSVPAMTVDEIKEACAEKAKKRFTALRERMAYIEGARIALEEDVSSPLFQQTARRCISLGTFVKTEHYQEPKPLRYIMCPDVRERGFCHALLMNAQRRLFGIDAQSHNVCCVKHMTEEQRKQLVDQTFGSAPVCNTDYSSMEGSVSAYHMEDIEQKIFGTLCERSEKAKIDFLWRIYREGPYHVSCKEYSYYLRPMRLSGQEHTSSGNWCCNFIWLCSIIYMATGRYPDMDKFKAICEGDDGLFLQHIPLDDGSYYDVDPEFFSKAAVALGAKLKINVYQNVGDASFCGILVKPSLREGKPSEELDLDTWLVLAKVLWAGDYDQCTRGHDGELLYARCLSYLPRSVGNKELYEALWWLACKWQPKGHTATSIHFRNIWLRVFYKGEDDDVPDVEKYWKLTDYAKKHNLPDLGSIKMPDVLKHEGPNNSFMEEEYVPKIEHQSFWSVVRGALAHRVEDTEEVYSDSADGKCYYHAVYDYLAQTNQFQGQQPSFDQYYNQCKDPNDEKPVEGDINRMLDVGQEVVVEDKNGDLKKYKKTVNGLECAPHTERSMRVKITKARWRGDLHADLRGPMRERPERIGSASGTFTSIMFGIALTCLIFCILLGKLAFTTIGGIPVIGIGLVLNPVLAYLGVTQWLIPLAGGLVATSCGSSILFAGAVSTIILAGGVGLCISGISFNRIWAWLATISSKIIGKTGSLGPSIAHGFNSIMYPIWQFFHWMNEHRLVTGLICSGIATLLVGWFMIPFMTTRLF